VIGVLCDPREEPAVRELFQLFKTPWALFDPGSSYDAVIVSGDASPVESSVAGLIVRFGAGAESDRPATTDEGRFAAIMVTPVGELPLYRRIGQPARSGEVCARLRDDSAPIVVVCERDGGRVIDCGYNLFAEVAFLLTEGQPPDQAGTPTLDLHIELLRRWLIEADLELVELAPTPPGCEMLATLTHDVDFLGIRRHTHDRTLVGFVYRASIGSAIDVIRGTGSIRRLLCNWRALLSLPFVHAGLIEDFWQPFDRYREADGAWRSTFFIVPFRGLAGVTPGGATESRRAVPYGAMEITAELHELAEHGYEIAVHGIDAWHSPERGAAELATVRQACGAGVGGVRMHWLYSDANSFAELDQAGFDYDATWGYNAAVGFRAGTSQVFAPLGARRLLELPLQIQDTALLYPGRMHCREDEAIALGERIIDTVRRTGGVATISWHERSLAPERMWDGVYRRLLASLRVRGASVRPAREIVSWFRLRREIDLEGVDLRSESVGRLPSATGADALRVRVHRRRGEHHSVSGNAVDFSVAASDLGALVRDGQLVGS
jgi:hypothetical protein